MTVSFAVPSLKILRKIDFESFHPGTQIYLLEEHSIRRQSIDPETNRKRSDVIDPRTGWVDNDLPRDEIITNEIMEGTKGFAVAGPLGQVLREFKTFADADKARKSAAVKLEYAIEGIEAPEEEGHGELAGTARRERTKGGLD